MNSFENTYKYTKFIENTTLYRLISHTQITNEPHAHEFLELAYICDGECTHILNGVQSTLKKGDYVIIDYNCVHNYIIEDDSKPIELIDCLFVPEFIDHSIRNCNSFKNLISSPQIDISYSSLDFNPSEYIFHDTSGYIYQLLSIMNREFNNPLRDSINIARHSLIQILLLTLREIHASANKNKVSSTIQYIINECKSRYGEKKLLDSICNEMHYSKPYLSSKFKKETKKNFKDYIVEIRMNEACRLLTNTNERVNSIASIVGYNDTMFFISTFKKMTGLTPTQFRKKSNSPERIKN